MAAIFCGIDGEGKGRRPHRYTLLACADETGEYQRHLEGEDLGTKECLDFLLGLNTSKKYKFFAYSFVYDLTMMLRDLPDEKLYKLFRPELRLDENGRARAVYWGDYRMNLMATRFTLQKGNRTITIWDIWKFFQGKFTKALTQWKVATQEQLDEIERMKNLRGQFSKVSDDDIRAYCYSECTALGQLARKLTDAHEKAGLKLKNYFGAGSTASAVLDTMAIRQLKSDGPERMQLAIASAFFGGRFESRVGGPVKGPIYSCDISSAYPYQLTRMPCLIHGRWEYTTRRKGLEKARAACVHYRLGPAQPDVQWGPFPHRLKDGTIIYPVEGGIGWVWLDEYLVAERKWPNVEFKGAWVLKQSCKCGSPFARISELYRERIRIGKTDAGNTLKLGMNSCYGKLAQSVGLSPPYQCWIWAGMITSGCRAQLLDVMSDTTLMVATDGLYDTVRPKLPKPSDTGTSDLSKPLGGWEVETIKQGVFVVRPGIYFPLNPTEEQLADIRGRGVGKGSVLKHWRDIVQRWEAGEQIVELPSIVRFMGAKSTIREQSDGSYVRSVQYGQWVKRPIRLSFDPFPKRDSDFQPWRIGLDTVSNPYDTGVISPEAAELRAATEEALEQPDVE